MDSPKQKDVGRAAYSTGDIIIILLSICILPFGAPGDGSVVLFES